MTVFSFHPVKHITTGEGGAVTTDNGMLDERLRVFRTHGITRNTVRSAAKREPWYYEQLFLGYNYRITDIQAALGISQLRKIKSFVERRKHIADRYDKAFAGLEGVVTPRRKDGCESSWHLYIIQIEIERMKVGRKEIFLALREENIGVNVHYIPVYYFPYYRKLGYKKGLCPNAEWLYERIITLPLFPAMTDRDVENVIEAVTKVVKFYRK